MLRPRQTVTDLSRPHDTYSAPGPVKPRTSVHEGRSNHETKSSSSRRTTRRCASDLPAGGRDEVSAPSRGRAHLLSRRPDPGPRRPGRSGVDNNASTLGDSRPHGLEPYASPPSNESDGAPPCVPRRLDFSVLADALEVHGAGYGREGRTDGARSERTRSAAATACRCRLAAALSAARRSVPRLGVCHRGEDRRGRTSLPEANPHLEGEDASRRRDVLADETPLAIFHKGEWRGLAARARKPVWLHRRTRREGRICGRWDASARSRGAKRLSSGHSLQIVNYLWERVFKSFP